MYVVIKLYDGSDFGIERDYQVTLQEYLAQALPHLQPLAQYIQDVQIEYQDGQTRDVRLEGVGHG